MSGWRNLVMVSLCCLLLGCQSRTVLIQSPPTPTAPALVAATPVPSASRSGGTANPASTPAPSSAGSPVSAAAASPAPSPSAPGVARSASSIAAQSATAPPASPVAASSPAPVACRYAATRRLVEVEERTLKEASGIAASQRWPGIYWALNDSGNAASVYAIDDRGRSRGTFRVQRAKNDDWEAIQIGPGQNGGSALYIGDIGDNDAERREITIYRVPEPEPLAPDARRGDARTAEAEAFKIQYPDGPRNAEGLLVHPKTGEILIVTKEVPGRAGIYRVPLPLNSRRTVTMEPISELDMAKAGVKIDVVTDATVTADASRVALRTYGSALELEVPPGAALASIWDQLPRVARLEDGPQGEGVTYRADGGALISIGESTPTHLYESARQCSEGLAARMQEASLYAPTRTVHAAAFGRKPATAVL